MTYDVRTLDGTVGGTITAANSGFASVNTAGSGGTATYQSTNAVHGQAGTFTTGSSPSNGNFARLNYAGGGASSVSTSFVYHFDTPTPATGFQIFSVRGTGARAYSLALQSSGILQGADAVNALTNFLTAAQIAANPTLRIVMILSNPSTTAGVVTLKAYTLAGVQVGSTVNLTNANIGTTNFTYSDVGVLTIAASVSSTFDDVQTNDGSTTELGAYSPPANVAPTITAGGPYTGAVGVPQTVTSVGVDSDGTIASYTRTFAEYPPSLGAAPTLTNGSSSAASYTPTVPGRYITNVFATDNSGANSPTVQEIVYVPGTTGYIAAVTSNTGWTIANPAAVNDANDGTYAESGAPGSGSVLVLRLSPLISNGTGWSLDVRSLLTAAGGTQTVELLEGSTVRKNWGALGPTTTIADAILTLTPGEIATIGNWNALDLRLTQV